MSKVHYIFIVLLFLGEVAFSQAKNHLADDAILDLPLIKERLVIAHYMTNMLPARRNGRINQTYDLDWSDPKGKSKELGGIYQTYPYVSLEEKQFSVEEAVEFEMRTALQLGVDGFHFFYPAFKSDQQMESYNQVIDAFYRVAEQKNIDFKLALCLCNPSEVGEEEMINRWAKGMKALYKGREESDKWLKTPDGRMICYTWVADGIIDELKGKHWMIKEHPGLIRRVAQAYNEIAEKADLPVAYNYHLRWPENVQMLEQVLNYFPAVCGWTNVTDHKEAWQQVAQKCKDRKRDYTQTVYPDFYTSKVYPKNGKKFLGRNEKVLQKEITDLTRRVHNMQLSGVFSELCQWSIDYEASLMNFTTWNDFPEGQHLAPEKNHNFGFSLLLQYYKQIWQGQEEEVKDESLLVFYKKYPSHVQPKYNIECRVTQGAQFPDEDFIEVVSLLKKKGELFVNGQSQGLVEAGLQVLKLPMSKGRIKVELKRNGKSKIKFTTPEAITETPLRTDRLTRTYSNHFSEIYEDIFHIRPKK